MKCRFFFIIAFYLSCVQNGHAQVFGGNPASTHWRQLGNDSFKIIFPENESIAANAIANTIAWQSRFDHSIGNKYRQVPIVLQPEVIYANGYVGLGPFRSEFYLQPPLDPFSLGSQNWAENLAVHEFRHVQQYNNFNVGLSKTMRTLFGQNGQALANAMSVPDWFFEGDAVYNETKLSRQGRGRLPLFMNAYASLFYAQKNYSYQKWRNGSYKDYVPNHYSLGYILVSYGYEKYGEKFWRNVTQDAAAFRHLLYPFQYAVRKYAGISFNDFVDRAFQYYRSNMVANDDLKRLSVDSLAGNNVVNYKYPIAQNNRLLAVRSSYTEIPKIVHWNVGEKIKVLKTQAITYDNYISSNGNKIIYSSWKPDLRWGNRQYSQVRILDVNSQKEKVIGRQQKWMQPNISEKGDSIVVIASKDVLHNHVVLLDTLGTVLDSIVGNNREIYSYPLFYKNSVLLFARKENGYMALLRYEWKNPVPSILIPYGNHLLGYPNLQNDTLFFSCSANGKDALWAMDLDTRRNYQVAAASTGIYGGGILNGKVVGSVFTADGNRMKVLKDQWISRKLNENDSLKLLYFDSLTGSYPLLANMEKDTTQWSSRTYSKLSQPFNFHSLQPEWDDPNYSVSLYGENVLNTIQSSVSYNYNRNEKYSSVGLSSVYGAWYLRPVISLSRTWNRQTTSANGNLLRWNEWNAAAGFSLPLNFSGGRSYRYLTYQSLLYLNNVDWINVNSANRTFSYWSNTISYSSYIQQATQQIYPRWGYSVTLQSRHGLSASAFQYLMNGSLYLPGLIQTHSLVVNAAYQRRDTIGNYTYSNGFPISRGYQLINYPQMWKLGANYHFPIAYPDCGWGNAFYLLRIRGNAFYDYSSLHSFRYRRDYLLRSTGAELYFDTNWWNQLPLTLGIRYSYMIDHSIMGTGASRWELILPVSIF